MLIYNQVVYEQLGFYYTNIMINTYSTIASMPKRLAAFKRYIETYECTYQVHNSIHSLIFYHSNTMMPYLLVSYDQSIDCLVLYANYQADNWSRPGCKLRPENIIKDMKTFILCIRECKKSEQPIGPAIA